MIDGCVIAVDCSLRITGVAVAECGRTLACESADLGRRQSAELPLIAERLLAAAGRTWRDISLVAAASGPGYFTGIRVGASYAAALAFALGVKILPFPSLELLALSAPKADGGILSVVYAGHGAVYASSFMCGDALPAGEYSGDDIRRWLGAHDGVTVISDAPDRVAETLSGVDITAVRPDVRTMAEAAWDRRASAVNADEFRPVYCRAPQGTAPQSGANSEFGIRNAE